MGTLCYSVRLESLVSISEKAFLATCFDGRKAILPKSQVFGQDYEVAKCEAYWISAWILERKDIQYSSKKQCEFDDHGHRKAVTYLTHTPEIIEKHPNNDIEELRR